MQIRPVFDLCNDNPETGQSTETIKAKLDEADFEAERDPVRLTGEEVFGDVRARVREKRNR